MKASQDELYEAHLKPVDDLPVCLLCKHIEKLDQFGRCAEVFQEADGSLVYCGCKCAFSVTADRHCPTDSTLMQSGVSYFLRCPECGYQEGVSSGALRMGQRRSEVSNE